MNPNRLSDATGDADASIESLVGSARHTVAQIGHAAEGLPTARARAAEEEAWLPRLLIIASDQAPAATSATALIDSSAVSTGTAVMIVGDADLIPDAPVLQFTSSGRAELRPAGLSLIPVGLTPDEALGCAAFLAQADQLGDEAVPPAGDTGWRELTDAAGSLATNAATEADPASGSPEPNDIARPHSDQTLPPVVEDAEEWDRLMPDVDRTMADRLAVVDSTLDQDLAEWYDDSTRRPKLRLLGPVKVSAHGKAIAKRKPYCTEVLSYIALRGHGATPDEVATAFGISANGQDRDHHHPRMAGHQARWRRALRTRRVRLAGRT